MDGERFDAVARWAVTRRGVVRGGLAAAAGALLGRGMPGAAAARPGGCGNAACAALCRRLYGPGRERGRCIAAGARGRGPCADLAGGGDCPPSFVDCNLLSGGAPVATFTDLPGCLVSLSGGGICLPCEGQSGDDPGSAVQAYWDAQCNALPACNSNCEASFGSVD